MPSGSTRVAGVIGDPVRHSRSPAIHNAAFEALGLDWVFVAFAVAADGGEAAVRTVATLDLGGLSVTMPHKAAAAAACDRLTDSAAALGAVNTVVPTTSGLLGASTDGEGFLRALVDEGVDPGATDAVVIGAGGAARAIVHALGRVGASVTVAARRPTAAREAAALAPGGREIALDDVAEAIDAGSLVVNATPIGMQGEDPPFRIDALGSKHVVVDAVYHPPETPLLAAARARGALAVNGIGMLVHQAALAFELWTGRIPPLDVMRDAATRSAPR